MGRGPGDRMPAAGRPQKMGDVLAELMARRGYAREQATAAYAEAWREAVGERMAANSRAGVVRRGVLEVIVSGSVWLQEITFQKQAIVVRLAELLPRERITGLRLRVGPLN